MKVSDLAPWAENPRKITPSQERILNKGMDEFGDLGCIIFNVNPEVNALCGGHQRVKQMYSEGEVTYTDQYDEPTRTGTVAEGFVEWNGEKWKYREVNWGWHKHAQAAQMANKAGGDWDWGKVIELNNTLDDGAQDMELTGWDDVERENMMAGTINLDDLVDNSSEITKLSDSVRKAIQIEFRPDDYELAQKLVKRAREAEMYVGDLLIKRLQAIFNEVDNK